jgi:hypothetical protein
VVFWAEVEDREPVSTEVAAAATDPDPSVFPVFSSNLAASVGIELAVEGVPALVPRAVPALDWAASAPALSPVAPPSPEPKVARSDSQLERKLAADVEAPVADNPVLCVFASYRLCAFSPVAIPISVAAVMRWLEQLAYQTKEASG